jgi:hypothetical protein
MRGINGLVIYVTTEVWNDSQNETTEPADQSGSVDVDASFGRR